MVVKGAVLPLKLHKSVVVLNKIPTLYGFMDGLSWVVPSTQIPTEHTCSPGSTRTDVDPPSLRLAGFTWFRPPGHCDPVEISRPQLRQTKIHGVFKANTLKNVHLLFVTKLCSTNHHNGIQKRPQTLGQLLPKSSKNYVSSPSH